MLPSFILLKNISFNFHRVRASAYLYHTIDLTVCFVWLDIKGKQAYSYMRVTHVGTQILMLALFLESELIEFQRGLGPGKLGIVQKRVFVIWPYQLERSF